MKKLIYVFALVAFFSCDKPADQVAVSPAEMKNVSFKENVALFDARVRAVDPQNFVREVIFIDFSKKGVLDDVMGFEGIAFADDGKRFDAKAGDGIFTAVEKTPYSESVKVGSLTGSQPKSLLAAPIVDPAFKRLAELSAYQVDHARNVIANPNARLLPVAYCEFMHAQGTCRAKEWGLCNDCCVVLRCTVIFL